MTYYNPLNAFYKSQIGAVKENNLITFRVKGDFDCLNFMCQKDGEDCYISHKMIRIGDYFEINIKFNKGLYFYYFDCLNGYYISKNDCLEGQIMQNISPFQLTAYKEDYYVPQWMYGGVIYQIFPDRFCRVNSKVEVPSYKVLHEKWNELPVFLPNEQGEIINNDFFGGNLLGIVSKLDYIQSLGVNIIYLNPIFKAFSNHRYDTGDYMQIDDLLGSMEDFKYLLKMARERNIKIVLDGVFNHTGDDSIYFNKYERYNSVGAYQSKDSPYYNWYSFIDYPNEYESWWGIKTLPAVNESNKSFIDFITGEGGVLDYYTNLGVDGWRLDVVDELPSSFVKNIRKAVKNANSESVIIGEVWEDASNKISYGKRREYLQGNELDSAMNYPLKNAILNYVKTGDSKSLSLIIKEQLDHYPHIALHSMMNLLSTHDTVRLLTVLDENYPVNTTKTQLSTYKIPISNLQLAKFRLKVATLLQFTLCGVPSIYYGDEVGMQGYSDPLNRCTFPWGEEDAEILTWYKTLSSIRKNYSAFDCGDFELIYENNGVIIYKRFDKSSQVLICINLTKNKFLLDFNGNMLELLTNIKYNDGYELKENSFAVFINDKEEVENYEWF